MKVKSKQLISFISNLHEYIVSNPQFRKDTSNKSESVISTAGEKLKNAKQKIQKFTNSLPKWLNSY